MAGASTGSTRTGVGSGASAAAAARARGRNAKKETAALETSPLDGELAFGRGAARVRSHHGAARQVGKPRSPRRARHRCVRVRARLPCAVARGPRRGGAFTRGGWWRSPTWQTAQLGAGGHRLLRRPPAMRRGEGGGLACGSPSAWVWRRARGNRAPDRMRVPVGFRHAVRIRLCARGARGDRRAIRRRRGAALPAIGSGRPARPSRRSGPDRHLHERRRGVCGWDHPHMRGARASDPRRRDLSEWLPVACRHRRLGRRQRGPWGAEGPRWSRFDPVSTRSC